MKIEANAPAQFKKSSPYQGTYEWEGKNTSVIKHGSLAVISFRAS